MIGSDVVLPAPASTEDLSNAVKKRLRHESVRSLVLLKHSIDARKKPLLYEVFTVAVNEDPAVYRAPVHLRETLSGILNDDEDPTVLPLFNMTPVVIAGCGPAGLFAALWLLRRRIPVVLLERGGNVDERIEATNRFFTKNVLDPECNVQFGEGGAGTFSDGKLTTGTHRTAVNDAVLRTFHEFGAPEEILYEAKPHVGTDRLTGIVREMRSEILRLGGTVRFHACLTGIECAGKSLKSVEIDHRERLKTDHLFLAIGHSARDTYEMLFRKGVPMSPKPFAIGVRIEHPEAMITASQYGENAPRSLGAAPYKLTGKDASGRGVYSFCMCPGGFVVNASSEEGGIAVNGMSNFLRNAENSNAAIVVEVSPSDFLTEGPLGGVALQREIEKKAFLSGEGAVPAQTFGDFLNGRKTTEFGAVRPSVKGALTPSDLNPVLPDFITGALKCQIPEFGKKIRGFERKDALLYGAETRTSSPLRILRDDLHESLIRGVFPIGEGAGYAGGIVSSAADGIATAELLFQRLLEELG